MTGSSIYTQQPYNNSSSSSFKYFLPHARLNRGQRKYCHCIMKARLTKKNPYGFCKTVSRNIMAQAARELPASKRSQFYVNPARTNCVMSYSYNDYSIAEIRAFCAEKGIKVYDIHSNGQRKYYPKDRLVQLLVSHYLNRARSKSSSNKTKKRAHPAKLI